MDVEIWKEKRQLTAVAVDEQPVLLVKHPNVEAWPALADQVVLARGSEHPVVRRVWDLDTMTLRVFVAWFEEKPSAPSESPRSGRPRAETASL